MDAEGGMEMTDADGVSSYFCPFFVHLSEIGSLTLEDSLRMYLPEQGRCPETPIFAFFLDFWKVKSQLTSSQHFADC
jgi:hypothetical protein